jgi:hypothetical protein
MEFLFIYPHFCKKKWAYNFQIEFFLVYNHFNQPFLVYIWTTLISCLLFFQQAGRMPGDGPSPFRSIQIYFQVSIKSDRLVPKNIHAFLVLKGATEMSFLVLKRVSGISEEDLCFILPTCSLVIELQFDNIEY